MPKPGVPLSRLSGCRQTAGRWGRAVELQLLDCPGFPATGVPWAGVALCQGCLGPLGGVRPPSHCGVGRPRAVWEPDRNVPCVCIRPAWWGATGRGWAHLPGAGWSFYSIPRPAGLSAPCPCPTAPAACPVQRTMQTGPCTGTRGSLRGREQNNRTAMALGSASWAVAPGTLAFCLLHEGLWWGHRSARQACPRLTERTTTQREARLSRNCPWGLAGRSGRHCCRLGVSVGFSDLSPS